MNVDNLHAAIDAACERACGMIAPAWPLDRAIAVNPHWQRIGMPLRRVAARMAVLGGMQVFPSRASHRQAWRQRRITRDALADAIAAHAGAKAAGLGVEACLRRLEQTAAIARLPLLIDLLDAERPRVARLSRREAITHQVSQACAAYFDARQADWQPDRGQGLYAFWRENLRHDHGIGALMGLPGLRHALEALPPTARDAEQWVLQRLGLPQAAWADYLEAVLLTVNGWASWCAYLRWQARLEGGDDGHLRDLLAIRLAWGVLVLESEDDAAAPQLATLQRAWSQLPEVLARAEAELLVDEVWQDALEHGYQRQLLQRLASAQGEPISDGPVEVQAAFCIDVRSEPMRRALEAVWPAVRTLGFAGFFGVPAAYTPLATTARRPQLPGLLAAGVEVRDRFVPAAGASDDPGGDEAGIARARRDRLSIAARWQAARRWPGAGFLFVEAAGMGYLGKLWQWVRPSARARVNDDLAGLPARHRAACRPQLQGLDDDAKVALAAGVLHAMGLERNLAPLVVLAAHGSQSSNNAHAAALDCGACCGQTGEVNARSLAQVLNEPGVRRGLRERGVAVDDATWFLAALHNTTTDEVEVFDLDLAPQGARERWERLRLAWDHAGDQVRRERAAALGLDPTAPHASLLSAFRRRANDGAQTRPEYGLAGNAAFLIAPRARSRGAVLAGRCFLHDYDAAQDADGSVLELLMTAPMVVTHWINWQYHASTCDPLHLGSGNKLLHNVVGGQLGVFEGNGGDLRIGLPRQSLHDGERWIHEPLRLAVVIDASREAIDAVIGRHAMLGQLLDNGWLHLLRFEGRGFERYRAGAWTAGPVAGPAAPARQAEAMAAA